MTTPDAVTLRTKLQDGTDAPRHVRMDAERLRSRLVAPAMHVMRGALTSIHGFSEFLLRQDPPQQQRLELLGIVHDQANYLSEVITELTELMRLEVEGAEAWRFAALSMGELMKTCSRESAARDRFKLTIEDRLPDIRADEQRLKTAMSRLLACVVDLSQPGEPLHIGLRREPEREFIAATVEFASSQLQTGDGGHLLEPFFVAQRPEGATGGAPGLALTRAIVEMHGGIVKVQSEIKDQSVRINLLLPMAAG
jgi:two-component system sensor histidine kinase BaeS